jgi:tRNA-dihydrouridine synthase B
MAGITDPPFRVLVQEFGVGALWSEMLNARAVLHARGNLRTCDLTGHTVPTFFQVSGVDPDLMAGAAEKLMSMGAVGIDLNMGCPVRRIVSRGSGAALMRTPDLARRIAAAVRARISGPMTVKIRSGWDETEKNAPEFARMLQEEGADCIILHCRSRSQVHSGPGDLDMVRRVREALRIPLIGNGGIRTVADARRMIDETGCDGVMIGRGALGRPWLPGMVLSELQGSPGPKWESITYAEVVKDHYVRQTEYCGLPWGPHRMRSHLAWYSRGFPEGAQFRREVVRIDDPDTVTARVENFFGKVAINEIE